MTQVTKYAPAHALPLTATGDGPVACKAEAPKWPPRPVSWETAAPNCIRFPWGRVVFTPPGPMGESGDITVEFNPRSIDSMQSALEFTQVLCERLRSSRADMRVEFYPADDHYHLVLHTYANPQFKAASGILRAFSKRVMHGQRGRQAKPSAG